LDRQGHKQSIMKPYIRFFFTLASIAFCFTANAQNKTIYYHKEIKDWCAKRIEALKAADGWLNLVGLFWLHEGINPFGSDQGQQIVFPYPDLPGDAGYFVRKENTVSLFVKNTDSIQLDGNPVKQSLVFDTAMAKVPIMSYGSLRWSIIRRGAKIGIRLRNLQSPQLTVFKSISRYPTNLAWKVKARLVTTDQPTHIAITNVLGQTNQLESAGKLEFSIGQKKYSLDALLEGDKLFVIFADATNATATYGLGRFLYADKAGTDGTTILDFNKAFNPPCAFTKYATCPLPPKQNHLPIAVTAGEKKYGGH
jgi:uncharacterized protein